MYSNRHSLHKVKRAVALEEVFFGPTLGALVLLCELGLRNEDQNNVKVKVINKGYERAFQKGLVSFIEASNDIIAVNGRISGLKCFFIVVVNYQTKHYVLNFY